jgi:hypothetical protein
MWEEGEAKVIPAPVPVPRLKRFSEDILTVGRAYLMYDKYLQKKEGKTG